MKGNVAFHLLNNLMDVAIEDRYRTKALEIPQSLLAVLGSPTPFRINRPKRDMGKKDDRCAGGAAFQILFQPLQLLLSQNTQAAFFDIHDIDEPDEMHALLVEAVPARAPGPFAEAFAVLRSVIVDDVMLARHVKDIASLATLQDLLERVEFLGFSEMGEVAGVEHEGRSFGQGVNFRHRLPQGGGDVFVRFLVETNMAVADLDETQVRPGGHRSRVGTRTERLGPENAAGHGPEDASAGPGH